MKPSPRREHWTVLVKDFTDHQLQANLERIQVDPYAIPKLISKMGHHHIWVKDVPAVTANILKQEALSKGGEAAVSREVLTDLEIDTDVILSFTGKQLDLFLQGLDQQPFGVDSLAREVRQTMARKSQKKSMKIGSRSFDFGSEVALMGILNVTPDSFSDGGLFIGEDKAVNQALAMIENGAAILDIGGESTRPGSSPVREEDELKRVIPVIKAIRKVQKTMPVSIDTSKAKVAEAAVKAGANMINDISAGTFDKKMFSVARAMDVPICLMHTSDRPSVMQEKISYNSLISDLYSFFMERIEAAVHEGIPSDRIILDPGIGFGKTTAHNLTLIRNVDMFQGLGRPILIGPSRKRFIGEVTQRDVHNREFGTAAAVALAVEHGADLVRVHNVSAMKDVLGMTKAIGKGCL